MVRFKFVHQIQHLLWAASDILEVRLTVDKVQELRFTAGFALSSASDVRAVQSVASKLVNLLSALLAESVPEEVKHVVALSGRRCGSKTTEMSRAIWMRLDFPRGKNHL